MIDRETGYALYEEPEEEFCLCEEDRLCDVCAAAQTRHLVQAGFADVIRLGTADPLDVAHAIVEDALLVDAAIEDATMARIVGRSQESGDRSQKRGVARFVASIRRTA